MASILPGLLRESAAVHGTRDAVVMDGERMSYDAVDAAADRFARSLVAHGVRRGDRVALWLPKSPRAIVALYGAMRAGAAYVPVDPGAPPARMAYIVRNCQAAGLVMLLERGPLADEALAAGGPAASLRGLWYADAPADPPHVAGIPGVPWSEV